MPLLRLFRLLSLWLPRILMNKVRQKKIAGLIQQALSDIFLKESVLPPGALVTISEVKLSADLSVANVYLSVYQVADPQRFMQEVDSAQNEIRKHLGRRIRYQVRRIPVLHFYLDTTLDRVFRLEKLFQQMKNKS